MDQITQNKTMKERLLDQSNKSDIPTITYITPKAIIFFISAAVTIFSLFGNWFDLDLDLGYLRLDDILGTVNPFSMAGALAEVEDSLGLFGAFMPGKVMDGLAMLKFISIALMVLAIGAIVLYVYAAFLRLKENDQTVRFGRLGALCALLTVVGFAGMIIGLLSALDASSVIGSALGKILTGPCMVTLIGAVVSGYCAVMDMGFKEDVVIYHNGVIKIDRGEKWKCTCCRRKNLSLLENCYYCGTKKMK